MTDDDRLRCRLAAMLAEARAALPPPPADALARLRTRQSRARRRRTLLTTATCAVLVFAVATLAGVAVDRGGLGQPQADSAADSTADPAGPAGTAGPAAESAGVIRIWSIRSSGRDAALRTEINAYNRDSGTRIELSLFANDDYKRLLATVIGTPQAPDVFFNWGGGGLAELVAAGQVVDLTEAVRGRAGFAEAFLPTVLDSGRVDGRLYGLPMNGTQPHFLFYNKEVFAAAGLRPPETYSQLLTLVDEFKARGIIPLALAGAQGWPQLMYLMYLTDRIGGPGKFADIVAGKPGAWTDPAVVQAARMCQELAERGAFGDDFATVGYDSDVPSRRLADGAAAMHLMGPWEYTNQLAVDADFVRDGHLGWAAFPAVVGGAGDPRDVVGAPANYFSVAAGSAHIDTAVDFLLRTLGSDRYANGLRAAAEAPGVQSAPPSTDDGFTTFVYRLAAEAPSFTLAWDQALRPSVGDALNANLRRLFLSQLTPEQFVAAMAEAR